MSPKSTHKLMGVYMEVVKLGVIHGFCFFELFPIGCRGLKCVYNHIIHVCMHKRIPETLHEETFFMLLQLNTVNLYSHE